MKSKFILVALLAFSISTAHSMTLGDLASPKAQRIILPCAAGMVLAHVLAQDIGVGMAICGASATYTLVNDHHDGRRAQKLHDAEVYLSQAKKTLEEHMSSTKEEYYVYQEAVRKIILEKLAEIQTASENQVEVYMKTPAFEAFLKKKTEEILSSSDDILENKLRNAKEEIRRQVTEEVLRDVLDTQLAQ